MLSGCDAVGGAGRVLCSSTSFQRAHVHQYMTFQRCRFAGLGLIALCQHRLSLVVEVCVAVESSGREPRRPDRDRHCSRFCSSLDTLLEKAV